ncbi:thioredoxin domain-containing protein [Chelatococcus sambhunathii]|uniref:Thioredoxin domain-containing protein n=1 Tax=Chelatococcus sambhunathii TaxID=363953 RepID=A0ABU1DC04_9HYPH|nr:DsbA family protein [Chelatococcus sambhunathii]MDR4305601.1 thioredoxin domain-containing protein [Chelatococcus sambhunathii]
MTTLARLGLAAALLASAAAPAFAFDQKEKEEIGKIVREYLIQNPDVLYEAQQEWNKRQEAKVAEKREVALKTYLAKIDEQKLHTVLGNPKGDVTLVEFFDYNCPYCRRAIKDIDQLIKDDPKLRVVLIELPVIREESLGAAQVSIAVSRVAPDRFKDFHDKLLGGQALVTKAKALSVAKELGLDDAKLQKEASSPEVERTLLASKQMADELGVEATPTYVIGESVVPNTSSVVDDLKGRAAAIRECGKAVC